MTRKLENAMKTLSDIADAMPSIECKDWKMAINTVLEALEQKPCEDAISRTNLLKKFEDRFIELQKAHQEEKQLGINWCINTLKDMPPVTPTRKKWIPVSERLPKNRNWYLGIFKEPDTGWINPLPFICDYVGSKTEATTKEHWILRGFTDREEHIDYYFNLECVAWMPLPEPYKAEMEGKE